MTAALKKPKRPKNRAFRDHLARLGGPMTNWVDRWGSISHANRRVFLTVWAENLVDGRYLFADLDIVDKRQGAKELRNTLLPEAVLHQYPVYGVLSERKRTATGVVGGRGFYDEDRLLKIELKRESRKWIGEVTGEVSVEDVLAGLDASVVPFTNVIDDLDDPPPGVSQPPRMPRTGTGYRRDPNVRAYVINQAKGECEHCGAMGFVLPDGQRYLEAHHIIGLANEGPDTVENVIALCASHHREAHYGKAWEALQEAFILKLREKRSRRKL